MQRYLVLLFFSLMLVANSNAQITEYAVGRCQGADNNNFVSGDYVNLRLPKDGSVLNIKFYVEPLSPKNMDGINETYVANTFSWAIGQWSAQVNNIFTTEVSSASEADVQIIWVSRTENDGANAQATLPRNSQWGIIAFTNEEYLYVKNANYPSGSSRNFDGVMLHETGHLLGLCHNNLNTVMTTGSNRTTLTTNDIQNIRMEYMPVTFTNKVQMIDDNSYYYGGEFKLDNSSFSVGSYTSSSANVFHKKIPSFREETSGNITTIYNDTILHLTNYDNQLVEARERNSQFQNWELDGYSFGTNLSEDKLIAYNNSTPLYQFTFVANHSSKWNVVINGDTEFDGSPQISRTPFAQNESGYITADETKTVAGKTLYFGGWENELTYNTDDTQDRVKSFSSVSSDINETALYKYKQHTTIPSAITTSQRRYARGESIYGGNTEDIVYTSDGNAWHEYNYNNNGWVVRKIGTSGATNPTVAADEAGDQSVIVYQQGTQLRMQVYMHSVYAGHFLRDDYLITNTSQTGSLAPTVVFHNNKILVVFRVATNDSYLGSAGLYYRYIKASDGTLLSGGKINNTGAFYINPSLAIDRNSSNFKAHLVYEYTNMVTVGNIYWQTLTNSSGNALVQSSSENLTFNVGDGYSRYPSIIVKNDGTPVVIWKKVTNRIALRSRNSSGWGSIVREFGYGASNGMIQRAFSNDDFIIGWTEGPSVKYAKNSNFSATSAGISGNGLQLAKGSTRNNIKMLTVGTDTYHTFNYKTGLGKSSSVAPNSARGSIVHFGSTSFSYTLADVVNNNEKIDFVELKENAEVANIAELNSYLQTKSFSITDGDELQFSLFYESLQYEDSLETLSETDYAKFKVEIVDVDNDNILATYDNVVFDKDIIEKRKEASYKLKISEVGTKNVILRLVVNSSEKNNFILSSISADSEILSKSSENVQEIYLDKTSDVVSSYRLYDNYPNPFNPTTVIKYHLKEADHVTLKIFNMLGQEISTLVDTKQEAGNHTINFNAKNLSSGVYLYRLDTRNYSATKKMTLLR